MVNYISRASAPIKVLPLELLDNILVLAVDMEKTTAAANGLSFLSWMKIGHVCRQWYEVLKMHKSLWNEIVAVNPDVTTLFLERAFKPSVRLSIRPVNDSDNEDTRTHLFDVLEEFAEKITSLDMEMPGAMWETFCNRRNPWKMRRLERMRLWTYGVTDPVPATSIVPFSAPILKELITCRFSLRTIQPLMSQSIEQLEVLGNVQVPASDIWMALGAMGAKPNLTRLTICATVTDDGTRQDIDLPHLQDFVLPVRSIVSAEVFTHIILPSSTSITLEIECDELDLDEVKAIVKTISPKINEIVHCNGFKTCDLSHMNAAHTNILFSPAPKECGGVVNGARTGSAGKQKFRSKPELKSQGRLELVLSSYQEEEEAQVYDALAEDLKPSLKQVTILKIEDMRAYNAPGLPPTRTLIGPFPSRLVRTFKRDFNTPGDTWHAELVCSRLRKMELRYVRFRKTYRDNTEDDFVDLLLRSRQFLQSETKLNNLTIRYAVNLEEKDAKDLKEAIPWVDWTGPLGAEDGGNEDDDDVEDVFGETVTEPDEDGDDVDEEEEVVTGDVDIVVISGNDAAVAEEGVDGKSE
ncbi:hypothetical protein NEOLEDRAFT_1180176 [Neolentinus lepideus HHB14362 ss-1]|uniref:Uncharacterized protein n=1 Tax=Neolentinus lepideus HHB14362 ss-1 TaxID=1314782 RepID=A0A165R4P6_9AGAM|nr:hypothetical protein NEOLEDRAFT_1180176 [Neolentinus lepideus HHB14362 ss-1]